MKGREEEEEEKKEYKQNYSALEVKTCNSLRETWECGLNAGSVFLQNCTF